jgi:hypothetical protein
MRQETAQDFGYHDGRPLGKMTILRRGPVRVDWEVTTRMREHWSKGRSFTFWGARREASRVSRRLMDALVREVAG